MNHQHETWPRHVALVMDGNGRWARKRRLPRVEGHRAGIKSARSAMEACRELGIPFLTLYTFSLENWNRPRAEVDELMGMLYRYLGREGARMRRENIRFLALGRLGMLPERVRRRAEELAAATAGNRDLTLVLALSYGGRAEIVDAVSAVLASRDKSAGPVAVEDIEARLYAPALPPPDLLIRTSGEQRLSNFLLWESAHTRLVFVPTLWPDFKGPQFRDLIGAERQRRAGIREATA